MSLPIDKLVQTAFAVGKGLVPQAIKSGTIRLGGSSAVDPETESVTTTWAHHLTGIDLLGYSDENEREQAANPERTLKTFAAKGADIPADAEATQSGEIVDDQGLVWQVYRVERDPAKGLFLFRCRR